jgi:hypothetical protein
MINYHKKVEWSGAQDFLLHCLKPKTTKCVQSIPIPMQLYLHWRRRTILFLVLASSRPPYRERS